MTENRSWQILCFNLVDLSDFSLLLNDRSGASNEGKILKRLVPLKFIILVNKLKPLRLTTGKNALLTSKMHIQPPVPSGLFLSRIYSVPQR